MDVFKSAENIRTQKAVLTQKLESKQPFSGKEIGFLVQAEKALAIAEPLEALVLSAPKSMDVAKAQGHFKAAVYYLGLLLPNPTKETSNLVRMKTMEMAKFRPENVNSYYDFFYGFANSILESINNRR